MKYRVKHGTIYRDKAVYRTGDVIEIADAATLATVANKVEALVAALPATPPPAPEAPKPDAAKPEAPKDKPRA